MGWSWEVPPGVYRGLPATGPAKLRAHLELVWSLLCPARWTAEMLRAGHAKYRADSELSATQCIF